MNSSVNSTWINSTGTFSCTQSPRLVDKGLQQVIFSLVIVTSLIGNSLIVLIVSRGKHMHTVSNILLCNISIADLLITILPMALGVIKPGYYNEDEWRLGKFCCIFIPLCVYMSVSCSILSLTMVSFDRYFSIVKPYTKSLRKEHLRYILVIIWFLSFLLAAPTLFVQKVITDLKTGKKQCMEVWPAPFDDYLSPKIYTVTLFMFLYAIPLFTMLILYTKLCIYMWLKSSMTGLTCRSRRQAQRRKRKVVIMLVIIVLIFAVGWFPVFLVQFLSFFDSFYIHCPSAIPQPLIFASFLFQYLSSALNPYVYFAFSGSYRDELRKLACFFKHQEGRQCKSPIE